MRTMRRLQRRDSDRSSEGDAGRRHRRDRLWAGLIKEGCSHDTLMVGGTASASISPTCPLLCLRLLQSAAARFAVSRTTWAALLTTHTLLCKYTVSARPAWPTTTMTRLATWPPTSSSRSCQSSSFRSQSRPLHHPKVTTRALWSSLLPDETAQSHE